MAASFLEGRRRSGKSKYAVLKIQQYLNEGRRVATNLDLFLENLCPDNNKASYVRIPDYPRSEDLFALGNAYPELDENNPDTYDENKNGVVVLDELLTSFNSRNWNDKDRLNVINWIVLSGKKGWDLYFIGQSFDAVDAQIRDTVVDRIISCRSNENLYPGVLWNMFIKPIYMRFAGKKHFAFYYDGKTKSKDTFSYVIKFRRNDLHSCYKTGQIFKKDIRLIEHNGKTVEFDDRVSYSAIGKDYFKLETKPDTQSPEVTKIEKQKHNYSSIALAASTLLFAFLYFTKPDTQIIEKPSAAAPTTKAVKEVDYAKQKNELKKSDLGQIYINCSVFSEGRFDYCFVDDDGQTVKPEYVGYQILYTGECHAKLKRQNTVYDVYCNPKIDIVEPQNYEKPQVDLASVF